jgi:hypothetical protein
MNIINTSMRPARRRTSDMRTAIAMCRWCTGIRTIPTCTTGIRTVETGQQRTLSPGLRPTPGETSEESEARSIGTLMPSASAQSRAVGASAADTSSGAHAAHLACAVREILQARCEMAK